jgi:hypothetical protein
MTDDAQERAERILKDICAAWHEAGFSPRPIDVNYLAEQFREAVADTQRLLEMSRGREETYALMAGAAEKKVKEYEQRLYFKTVDEEIAKAVAEERKYWEDAIRHDGERAGIDTRGVVGMAIVHLLVERVEGERERCARVAEDHFRDRAFRVFGKQIAAAIREVK